MKGFNPGLSICLLFVFLALTIGNCFANEESKSACVDKQLTLPLLDYTKISSYGKLPGIEDAGYFRVGRRYVHAPKVEFKPIEGACCYDLLLLQGDKLLGVTKAEGSGVFAENGWQHIKPGKAGIAIIAYNQDSERIALSKLFPFYAAPDFSREASADKKRSYKEAALMAFNSLCDFSKNGDFGQLDSGPGSAIKHRIVLTCSVGVRTSTPFGWANLHDWMYVDMLVSMNKFADKKLRQEIVEFARSVGDHILMCRLSGEDYKYNGLILGCVDFNGGPALGMPAKSEEERKKMERLIEPSKCGYSGKALINIYQLTGEKKYLDAAVEMAQCLSKTQLEDGSWYARVDGKTGEQLGGSYSTSVISVADFMDALNEIHPDKKWIKIRDKAIEWTENNPFKTHGWVLNFDDNPARATSANPYAGLSNWDLFSAVRYVSARPELFSDARAIIQDQLRWNDNHFVFYGEDPLLTWDPFYPTCGEQGNPTSYISWGDCWLPMDFHTANWGSALLAAYKITKDEKYLEKALCAANALTQYQLDDGRTLTWMADKTSGLSSHISGNMGPSHTFWPAAWAMSAHLWAELVAMDLDN